MEITCSIDFKQVLDNLGDNSIISFSNEQTYLHLIYAESTNAKQRFFYNDVTMFLKLHEKDIKADLCCTLTATGEVQPLKLSDDTYGTDLLNAVSKSIHKSSNVVPKAPRSGLIIVLALFVMLGAYYLGTQQTVPSDNVFDVLDEIPSVSDNEYKPGLYKVTSGDSSRVFNVVEIDGHSWKCEDNITLWVSKQLDIWKGSYLVLRMNDYSIEEIK